MAQTLVFESDEESELTDEQVDDLVRLLRSLTADDTSFGMLRVELSGATLPPLAVTSPGVKDKTGAAEAEREPPSEEEPEQETAEVDEPDEDEGEETETESEEIEEEAAGDGEEKEEEDEVEDDEGEDVPEIEQQRQDRKASGELPPMNSGTRRFTIASILYHADGYLTTGDLADITEGEEWELSQSALSTELYRMYGDFVVHRRQKRGNGAYEYWLTNMGTEALEEADADIEPDPFDADSS